LTLAGFGPVLEKVPAPGGDRGLCADHVGERVRMLSGALG
jgi:hypothetical protein